MTSRKVRRQKRYIADKYKNHHRDEYAVILHIDYQGLREKLCYVV